MALIFADSMQKGCPTLEVLTEKVHQSTKISFVKYLWKLSDRKNRWSCTMDLSILCLCIRIFMPSCLKRCPPSLQICLKCSQMGYTIPNTFQTMYAESQPRFWNMSSGRSKCSFKNMRYIIHWIWSNLQATSQRNQCKKWQKSLCDADISANF